MEGYGGCGKCFFSLSNRERGWRDGVALMAFDICFCTSCTLVDLGVFQQPPTQMVLQVYCDANERCIVMHMAVVHFTSNQHEHDHFQQIHEITCPEGRKGARVCVCVCVCVCAYMVAFMKACHLSSGRFNFNFHAQISTPPIIQSDIWPVHEQVREPHLNPLVRVNFLPVDPVSMEKPGKFTRTEPAFFRIGLLGGALNKYTKTLEK